MNYQAWREDIFGKTVGTSAVTAELLRETYDLSPDVTLSYIVKAMDDPDIHSLFLPEQIGVGLELMFHSGCSNIPNAFLEAADESKKVAAMAALAGLYSNYFERYCTSAIKNIGNDCHGAVDVTCHMFWDVFSVYPKNASPAMVAAGLKVMAGALESNNDRCSVSAIHGLGHWGHYEPLAVQILSDFIESKPTMNPLIMEYAQQAVTGYIQ